jgi:uncharacterized iron-regulated membrane protein
MTIGTSIFVIALGAILAFAVRTDLGWLDVQVAGGVLMLTGAVMLAITLVMWSRRRRRASQNGGALAAEERVSRPAPGSDTEVRG